MSEEPEQREQLVGERMHRDFPTVSPDSAVGDLARLLSDERLSSVPVVEDGRLAGIVGQSDLIFQELEDDVEMPHTLPIFGGVIFLESMERWRERFRRAFGTTVADLMSTDVQTVGPDATLHEAAKKMVDEDVNRLPVVDDQGAVLGVISRADVVRALAEEW
jgi:CBS domain-containing protein